MKKKLKVLVLFDGTSPTTVDQDFSDELKTKEWKTEADVMNALGAMGHTPEHLAIYDDVDLLRQKLEMCAPDVLFNLVEQFRNKSEFDQNIVSFFEMQGLPFTGCGSTGLTLCKHKGISKDSALSRNSCAEFRGHPARAANRTSEAAKISARGETGEKKRRRTGSHKRHSLEMTTSFANA